MARFKKFNSHLAKDGASGKLVNDCDCCVSPSPDCSNCDDCDDGIGSTVTLVVSGFTGGCTSLNVTILLTGIGGCAWEGITGDIGGSLDCPGGGSFRINVVDVFSLDPVSAFCEPCSLICVVGAATPTGSGSIVGEGICGDPPGQIGSFTLT